MQRIETNQFDHSELQQSVSVLEEVEQFVLHLISNSEVDNLVHIKIRQNFNENLISLPQQML